MDLEAVVLQDNRFIHQRKHPIQAADHPLPAAKVYLREVLEYFAGPVDSSDDLAYLTTGFRLALPILLGPSAMSNNLVGRALEIASNTWLVVWGLLKTKKRNRCLHVSVCMNGDPRSRQVTRKL